MISVVWLEIVISITISWKSFCVSICLNAYRFYGCILPPEHSFKKSMDFIWKSSSLQIQLIWYSLFKLISCDFKNESMSRHWRSKWPNKRCCLHFRSTGGIDPKWLIVSSSSSSRVLDYHREYNSIYEMMWTDIWLWNIMWLQRHFIWTYIQNSNSPRDVAPPNEFQNCYGIYELWFPAK